MSDHVLGRKLSIEVQNRGSAAVAAAGYDPNYNPIGLKVIPMRTNPRSGLHVLRLHYTLHPKVDDAWIAEEKRGMSRIHWERDMELKYNALGGRLIFEEYKPDIHVIPAFKVPDDWWRFRFIDYGRRNPTCCLWIAVDYEGNAYVYREWYHPTYEQMQMSDAAHVRRYTLSQHAFFIRSLSGDLDGGSRESYVATLIDPQAGEENFGNSDDRKTVLMQLAQEGIPCSKASKATSGLDKLEEMFRLRKLFFFAEETPNLQLEIANYRWEDFTEATQQRRNKKEAPLKRDDHAMNCLKFFGNFPVKRTIRNAVPPTFLGLVREDLTDKERMTKDIKREFRRAEKRQKQRRMHGFGPGLR